VQTVNVRRRTVSARRRDGSGEVLVVRFNSTILDSENIAAVRPDLFARIEQRPACKLLLNFRNVEYVSSAALGLFITLHRTMEAGGGRLVFCFLRPEIYEVFEQFKFDRILFIEDDPAADEDGVELSPLRHTVPARKRPDETATGADPVILPFPPPKRE
jgi:anti-sigma B factor antagonist